MSTVVGSNFPVDGLVFESDPGNRKSLAGYGAERLGGILPAWGPWSGMTGSTAAYKGQSGTSGVYINTILQGGASWWSSANNVQCTPSTRYVITARVRFTPVSPVPHPNLFYVRQFNASMVQTSESGKFNADQKIDLGNGFYLVYAYFTTDATATSFYIQGYEYGATMNIWLEDVQCRLSGLGDLTGANLGAIGINDPAYDSVNKSFLYNGTNQYLNIPSMANQPAAAITCMGWMKATKTPATSTIRGGVLSSTNSMYLGIIDSVDGGLTHSLHWAVQTSVSRPYSWVTGLPANTWVHITGTYNGSTSIAFVNGVQVWSANVTGSIPAATYCIGTYAPNGADGSHNFQGNIGQTLIYSRALVPSEVLQHFNATRVRYGI